jgi:uncharacterized protein YdaU (DUF1376 family)
VQGLGEGGGVNYFELHLGDYDKATAHLTACEDGIYGRLLRRYYDTEAPLCADVKALQRFVRARSKDEQQAVQTVLDEFFVLEADGWHHKRCDQEIQRYREKSQKARESVSKRWAKRDADAMPTHNETPTEPIREAYERNTDDIHRAPVPRHQTPDTTLVPKVQRESAKGSRLPPGWAPQPEHMAFAEGLGLRNGKAAAELEKFRDHWAAQPGQKGVKADWSATWRNWVRRAVDGQAGKPGAVPALDLEGMH